MIKELKSRSKEAMTDNFLKITGLYFVSALSLFIFVLINDLLVDSILKYTNNRWNELIQYDPKTLVSLYEVCTLILIIGIVGVIILFVLSQFMQLYSVIYINKHKEFPEYKDIIKTGSKDLLKKCLVVVTVYIMVVLGLYLFIFPGVIVLIGISVIGFMLLDEEYKDYSVIRIIKEAFSLTNGYKLIIFKLFLSLLPLVAGYSVLEVLLMKSVIGSIIMIPVRANLLFYIMSINYNMYVKIKEEKSNAEIKEESI